MLYVYVLVKMGCYFSPFVLFMYGSSKKLTNTIHTFETQNPNDDKPGELL